MANKYRKYSKVDKNQFFKRIHRRHAFNCARKKSYNSKEQASNFLDRHGYTGYPYKCQHCHKWHNSSK